MMTQLLSNFWQLSGLPAAHLQVQGLLSQPELLMREGLTSTSSLPSPSQAQLSIVFMALQGASLCLPCQTGSALRADVLAPALGTRIGAIQQNSVVGWLDAKKEAEGKMPLCDMDVHPTPPMLILSFL